ncbi:MAG: sigma factor, partial [Thermoleophilaceae bacterium]
MARAHRAAFLIVHDAAAAEDIAQEAFLAAVRARHRFDRRRPFGPLLHRIVVGRLWVAESGPWIVEDDGARRRLG